MSVQAPLPLLYCNQSMGMGGAETFMTDLLASLQRRGWQVTVATTNSQFAQQTQAAGLSTITRPWVMDVIGNWKGLIKAVVFGPLAAWQWWQLLRRHQGAVLLSGFNEKLLVTPLAHWLGLPIIWIEFSSLASVLALWGGSIGRWYRSLLPQVKVVITASEHSRASLRSQLRLSDQQLVVIPCGSSVEVKKITIKKQKKLLCLSRLQPGKGQDLLLKAFAKVLLHHPTAHLTIVGEGDFLAYLQKLAHQLKVSSHVTFAGRVTIAEHSLVQANIVVFPSMWELEGFGLVLIEAMAAGVPVVTFDRGPLNEIIHHKRNGLLAKSGSIDDLADQLILLLARPTLQQQLAQQAQQDFTQLYTIDQVAERYAKYLTYHHR